MALNQNYRLRGEELEKDGNSLIALKEIPDYNPTNPDYSFEKVSALYEKMRERKTTETKAEQVLKTAHDEAVNAEWEFHNTMLKVKDQIIAQFGDDSNEIQSLGLKKKSQRKRPQRKPKSDSSKN